MSRFTIYTAAEKPELLTRINTLAKNSFPRFIFDGEVVFKEQSDSFLEHYPECQFALFDGEEMVSGGVTVPLSWNGSMEDLPETTDDFIPFQYQSPNVLCALAGLVADNHRGRGISRDVLLAMKRIGQEKGFSSLIAPVRPNHKERYPLLSLDDYIHWKREDGAPYDPWIRVHWRLKAPMLKIMPKAAVVRGTIREWEDWTGMRFLSSGPYVVPGALVPVEMDLEKNEGVYLEPNIWMEHQIEPYDE
ncbi:GNAT family N-acetyltransferase [Desmospora activa]|uniref:Acetyltransferase (GNAT) family protein n=1 Tax=Desmospora activa DSM 45169 TaxID=1121389 RepID=A0A2T4Z0N2_9BACL|nr:GNAT family N-acetyltransferase [Desmospora activa]PTM53297.1 hypothetical protein C8J48_3621 [Desmospora activa DSM 45169]